MSADRTAATTCTATMVSTEDGKGWVCPVCGHSFQNPPPSRRPRSGPKNGSDSEQRP